LKSLLDEVYVREVFKFLENGGYRLLKNDDSLLISYQEIINTEIDSIKLESDRLSATKKIANRVKIMGYLEAFYAKANGM
jgi:hypothetical protein